MDQGHEPAADDYALRLKRMLAQFPPLSDMARKRLIKTYEAIEPETDVSESA